MYLVYDFIINNADTSGINALLVNVVFLFNTDLCLYIWHTVTAHGLLTTFLVASDLVVLLLYYFYIVCIFVFCV